MPHRINLQQVRSTSSRLAQQHGLDIPPTLPVLETPERLRDVEQVLARVLCLNVVAAVAHGFPNERGLAWTVDEGLTSALTEKEKAFLAGPSPSLVRGFQEKVEAAWALAWVLRQVAELDPWAGADPMFVRLLPDLKVAQPSTVLRERITTLRPAGEILAALDLSYCLHWILRQSALTADRRPTALTEYVVVERRRALEWVVSDQAWDEISLDT